MENPLQEVAPPGAPPVFDKDMMDKLGNDEAVLSAKIVFPDPMFSRARIDKAGRRLPQAIAHRGDKAHYPENTMLAFEHAIKAGAHALETDVHLTKDDVVVLSHDANLNRCFGVDRKIIDCDWEELEGLRTIDEPHEPLAKFQDLLEYVAQPKFSKIWLLLDIKLDNKPDDIIKYMSQCVSNVEAPEDAPWEDRILLGCWAAKFMTPCRKYFEGFPITNIGFSIAYSSQFLVVPNISFNMLQACLVSPAGQCFLREAQAKERAVYAWTVNNKEMMDWCIRRGLDGVVTDDVKKFLDYCDAYNPTAQPSSLPIRLILQFVRINILAWLFGLIFRLKQGSEPRRQIIKMNS